MEEFEKMAGELAESEAEGEAQDVVNLASADPASDSPQVEAAEEPAAESSEEVAAEPHTGQQV
jgi:hypothetical protein